MPPYSIRRSSIAQIRANEHGLTRAHYAEVFGYDHAALEWATLARIEDEGRGFSLAVWDDLRLVGYAICLLSKSPQDGIARCVVNGIYIHPEWREFGLWRQLSSCVKDTARACGVSRVVWGAGAGTRFDRMLGRLASRRGSVRLVEHTYEEELA